MKDHNAAVQIASAGALAGIGEAACAGLEELISFYDASTVKLAAVALGEIGLARSLPVLLELVAGNPDVPGEYPDLFDAVCAAADSVAKLLSSPSGRFPGRFGAAGRSASRDPPARPFAQNV